VSISLLSKHEYIRGSLTDSPSVRQTTVQLVGNLSGQ